MWYGLWLYIFSSGIPQPLLSLDVDRYTSHDLLQITSPTGLLLVSGTLLAAADLDQPMPGIYELRPVKKGTDYRAQLLKILPQQALEGVSRAQDGGLLAVASRYFTAYREDWQAQILKLEPARGQIVGRHHLPVPARCYNGNWDCGLIGVVAYAKDRWFAVKKKDPARIYLLEGSPEKWKIHYQAVLGIKRRFSAVSDIKFWDPYFVFLIKDRWALGVVHRDSLPLASGQTVNMDIVFDFSELGKKYQIKHQSIQYAGLAEGFEIDEKGGLVIVLNNRGFPFRNPISGTVTSHPKLIRFYPREVTSGE